MPSPPRRACPLLPQDKQEQRRWIDEILNAARAQTPHPNIINPQEKIHAERLFNIAYQTSFLPPLPHSIAEHRLNDRAERELTREDIYGSPRIRSGGVWVGD